MRPKRAPTEAQEGPTTAPSAPKSDPRAPQEATVWGSRGATLIRGIPSLINENMENNTMVSKDASCSG
eukprot:5719155-Pyramimonas_sp.AAC.1